MRLHVTHPGSGPEQRPQLAEIAALARMLVAFDRHFADEVREHLEATAEKLASRGRGPDGDRARRYRTLARFLEPRRGGAAT